MISFSSFYVCTCTFVVIPLILGHLVILDRTGSFMEYTSVISFLDPVHTYSKQSREDIVVGSLSIYAFGA